jgi:hypothetical protein
MADDDPFSVFSDDDDESAGDEAEDVPAQPLASANEASSSRIAKSLMEQANARLQTNQTVHSASSATAKEEGPGQAEAVDLSHLQRLDLDWPPPTYLGPMILVSALAVGGGRGYVASRTLEPGTLMLVEEAAMKWPTEQLGQKLGLVSVKHLLEQPSAISLVQDMEAFHPTKENVDHHAKDAEHLEQIHKMMQTLQSEYEQDEILEIVELAKEKGITSRDGSLLASNDILRLFLALRYNGLESGVYRHVAMLNHDCHPNCAKLLPEGNQSYSEVRTTRRVPAGVSLAISYVPRIMSHASRRKHLWEQHRFDIGAQLKGSALKMELIGNDLPQSHIQRWEEENIAHRIENATAELEKILDDLQDDIDSGGVAADTWETLKALEQTSLELFTESTQQLKNNNHILLIPILVVHTETCDQLHKAPELAASVHLGILSRQVLSFHCLIPLQIANLGPDHFDLARTNLDLANAISELLSRSPKKLYDLNLSSLLSFEQWSLLEHSSRQEHKRIKTLYPHDAESFIKGVTPA